MGQIDSVSQPTIDSSSEEQPQEQQAQEQGGGGGGTSSTTPRAPMLTYAGPWNNEVMEERPVKSKVGWVEVHFCVYFLCVLMFVIGKVAF